MRSGCRVDRVVAVKGPIAAGKASEAELLEIISSLELRSRKRGPSQTSSRGAVRNQPSDPRVGHSRPVIRSYKTQAKFTSEWKKILVYPRTCNGGLLLEEIAANSNGSLGTSIAGSSRRSRSGSLGSAERKGRPVNDIEERPERAKYLFIAQRSETVRLKAKEMASFPVANATLAPFMSPGFGLGRRVTFRSQVVAAGQGDRGSQLSC